MYKYASWAQARADELLDLFEAGQTDILREWLRDNLDEEMLSFIFTLSPRIGVVLAQTPTKDQAWQAKTARPKFLREWLAARHWALLSANALSLAAELERIPGLGYRDAVRETAPIADKWMAQPSLEDLLTKRLSDG